MSDDACAEDLAELEDAVVDDGVDRLSALATEVDQTGRPEDGEVFRHRRLLRADGVDECPDVRLTLAEPHEDAHACLVADGADALDDAREKGDLVGSHQQ